MRLDLILFASCFFVKAFFAEFVPCAERATYVSTCRVLTLVLFLVLYVRYFCKTSNNDVDASVEQSYHQ